MKELFKDKNSMKSIMELEREIVEAFDRFARVDEKYAYLFQLGNELPEMSVDLKNQTNLVEGCQSKLWFSLIEESGRFSLSADSDSMVIKGIAALLVRIVEDRTAEEISQISMDFIDQLNIWKLPSERNNGLVAMLDHLHQQAREYTGISKIAR